MSMKKPQFWLVDSFAKKPFQGNPASVIYSEEPLTPNTMLSMAKEFNQSETAFISPGTKEAPSLRWYTVDDEIDLCGHATLAAAHVWLNFIKPQETEVTFETQFVGPLRVTQAHLENNEGEHFYEMEFPSRAGDSMETSEIPDSLLEGLGLRSRNEIVAIRKARDLLIVVENEDRVRQLKPDFSKLSMYPDWVILSAPAKDYDFVSRFFCASDGIEEDPVTGSAHCTLGPYWAQRLEKNDLKAFQASQRGGELFLKVSDSMVKIKGQALTILEGLVSS